jgi:hypothetical protein
MAETRNLYQNELEDLVEWFCHRMGQDQRALLMAERPQEYAKLFPSVDADIILARVRERLGVRKVWDLPAGRTVEVNVRAS